VTRSAVKLQAEILRAHAEVGDGVQGARSRLERLQEQYRTSGEIVRAPVGATAVVIDRPLASKARRPIARVKPATAKALPFGHPPEAVVIRTHSTEPERFRVTLAPEVRRDIEEEISFVRRSFGGEPREAAGFLFSAQRPRAGWGHLTVGLATTAGDSKHGLYSVQFGAEPIDVRASFPPWLSHMSLAGDFHSHAIPGSTIPSDVDARAWAGQMDRHALERYIGVLVTPAESGGWMYPRFNVWTVRREGVPSLPVCEPAVLEW
jgi:hypothetical protein